MEWPHCLNEAAIIQLDSSVSITRRIVGFTAIIAELAISLFKPRMEELEGNWKFVLLGVFSKRMRLLRGVMCEHIHGPS